MTGVAGLDRGGWGFHALDAFTDPVVLSIDGALRLAHVQAVVRALGQAVGMSPSGTFRLIVGASELAGPLFQGSPPEGKILLRLLRNDRSVGMEIILECGGNGFPSETPPETVRHLLDECEVAPIAGGGNRLVARKWESSMQPAEAGRRSSDRDGRP